MNTYNVFRINKDGKLVINPNAEPVQANTHLEAIAKTYTFPHNAEMVYKSDDSRIQHFLIKSHSMEYKICVQKI